MRAVRVRAADTITLLCPGQAFPVPMFRYSSWLLIAISLLAEAFSSLQQGSRLPAQAAGGLAHHLTLSPPPPEPVGFAAPKFPTASRGNIYSVDLGSSPTLLCPAQAYPVPAFSSGPKFPTAFKSLSFSGSQRESVTILCPAQAFPVPQYRVPFSLAGFLSRISPLCLAPRYTAEPVGSSAPKFPNADKSRTFAASRGQSLTILCPAQAFPVPHYSARPKFAMTDKSRTFAVSEGESQTLLCPAQAFPVPHY
ncbi:hypothetical protein FOCC_FOCC004812, partial [Frankliniella occidentalis]